MAVRDSGKTLLDAIIGEVLVTCEKLAWLADSGESYLAPEKRPEGTKVLATTIRDKAMRLQGEAATWAIQILLKMILGGAGPYKAHGPPPGRGRPSPCY